MSNLGKIQVDTTYENILGKDIFEFKYKWTGGPVCKVSHNFIFNSNPEEVKYSKELNEIQIGPYKLRILYEDFPDFTCIRKDYPFLLFIVWWHNSTRWIDLIYRRVILTLAVWRLAKYDQATIPSPNIHDIYLIRWLKRIMK